LTAEWTFSELNEWDEKICNIANNYGLEWFPIEYEICNYYDMIGHISYGGMPSQYPHWSYGKAFERTHQFYNLGIEGLPYELIINSDPSIAYLMRENPLYLQILIMCHCTGHSDFFKNNRFFKDTNPTVAVSRFRNARNRIKKYMNDTSIGIDKVESFLDAVRSIQYQIDWNFKDRISHVEMKKKYINKINRSKNININDVNLNAIPLESDYDLLGFIIEHGHHLEDWKRDILEIVKTESQYFIPQIRTKILNEGWASFWHYKIMHDLDLPQEYHLAFLKSHNQVVRPHLGKINPYNLGFHLFTKMEKNKGLEECFFTREVHDDESAIRNILDREDCEELNLFSYSHKKKHISIDEISDEDGWKIIKKDLIKSIGSNSIPKMYVKDLERDKTLILEHEHDGRDLDLRYSEAVVEHVRSLWEFDVKLFTIIEEDTWEI